ncbi:hypothetical protein GCM10011380_00770 [Sphingomonas metalli]|uniref:Uncharacterized protein n=1 Tax=Sphingomonas metalli TaxID=1779358 RepID=A0A916WNG3_9SPHN|nr:hypothetical protein [Sphingomonas metalli]GGB15201.1 hypothetical protein GCM10011380_00770 [Sphingomonas metalli]
MLIVRLQKHFRERQMEWALAAMATGWGAILMSSPSTFARPFYAPLRRMFSAEVWGWAIFAAGLLGLVTLFINGAWRRTPFLRQVSSGARMTAWAGLLFGCLSVEWQTPAAVIYAGLLFMDGMAMSNATADGQRAKSGTAGDGH